MENLKDQIIVNEPKSSFKFLTPKLIFGVLAAVIVIEIFYAVRTLTAPIIPPKKTAVQPVSSPKVLLTSPHNQYKVGDSVPVSITVDTGGKKSVGTDVILRFDPKALEATTSSVQKGTIYQDYPSIQVDSKSGTVTVSGIASIAQNNFTGVGILATVNFKAKASGNTSLNLDFQKDSTTDTNIVESTSGKDVLEKVEALNLTIK